MKAGMLRHLIKIEAPTTQNVKGEMIPTWGTFAEAYAAREDLAGRELFLSQQVQAEVTTRFRIRYLEGVSAKMRINDAGTIYNIKSVQDPEGRRRFLTILATRAG
jgi:SPP1 family predicted phage head-tail adaptor